MSSRPCTLLTLPLKTIIFFLSYLSFFYFLRICACLFFFFLLQTIMHTSQVHVSSKEQASHIAQTNYITLLNTLLNTHSIGIIFFFFFSVC